MLAPPSDFKPQRPGKALVDAGAGAFFLEVVKDLHEFRAIRDAVDVPILADRIW
jgi:methylisocitrate lyase